MTDKHLFSELIYIGPKALVALKVAICDLYGGEEFEDEDGHVWTTEETLADLLIDLAGTEQLRISVITQHRSMASEEYVLGEAGFFGSQGEVDPPKRAELVRRLAGRACIYATEIKADEAMQKRGV